LPDLGEGFMTQTIHENDNNAHTHRTSSKKKRKEERRDLVFTGMGSNMAS